MDLYSLDDKMQRLVSDELDRSERAVWMAQPAPRGGFPWMALPMVLFGVFWTGFTVFWISGVSGILEGDARPEPTRLIFALFGVPFLLVGCGMLSSPYWMMRRLRRAAARTVYLITDRRAIIFDGGYLGDGLLGSMMAAGPLPFVMRGLRIHSYLPEQLTNIERVQRDDGSGDVLFGEIIVAHEGNGRRQNFRSGFYSLTEVKRVEDMLKTLAARAK